MTLRSNVAASVGHKTSKSGRKLLCELLKLLAIKSTLTVNRKIQTASVISLFQPQRIQTSSQTENWSSAQSTLGLFFSKNGATEMILILKRLAEKYSPRCSFEGGTCHGY